MSTIVEHTPLEVLLADPVMKHFNWAFVQKCNTELAQLRAQAAQAEALEQAVSDAAVIIKAAKDHYLNDLVEGIDTYDSADRADAWLAAHAPAPQMCKCISAEKPISPCGLKCWHFNPDGGVMCLNCGNTGIQQEQAG